ncbi:DUF1799 domain-containing protein [Pseudorhodobacter sp.]|uniref:DUF1799 domain-containing protein n=1 Tax=Pseudorhodobacter sp. TaxID=1934400 RepID=UPI002648D665|nr:DUF1799 domain-containing protein [Pseudorhodobacter sp.]MDN5786398.1 DUF1799 domain-containing protein [Pseudorhodobacter sp.]
MDAELAGQFERMGVAVEHDVNAGPEAFEIMAQNVDCFRVWLGCETQWRVAVGMGSMSWLGLDYGAVDVVLRRVGLETGRANEVFGDLMVMEAQALGVFGEEKQ